MNLNKYDRDAFVAAVMDDVPMVDYKEIANTKAVAAVVALLPKEVQAVYKKFPGYLDNNSVHMPHEFSNLWMPRPLDGFKCLQNNAELWEELKQLAVKAKTQEEARDTLSAKLRGAIESCRTLKQAQERLPEFAKYLPADRDGSSITTLPVANIVADLTSAGWPKSKAKAKAKK